MPPPDEEAGNGMIGRHTQLLDRVGTQFAGVLCCDHNLFLIGRFVRLSYCCSK